MAVKILIKRNVSADKAAKLKDFAMQLRTLCVKQPGYISGESLKNLEKPDEYLVVSTWDSLDAWKSWVGSAARAEVQNQIDALLGAKTEYEVYEYRP
ncbi:MAG: antibiotic biosynthesis monooxygenase family protein [Syntrophaceae bacterium]